MKHPVEITLQKTAELISNGLAIPMILLSFAVVYLWFKPAVKSAKGFQSTPEQWFILGVFSGFLGEFADNIYWTIAWSLAYLELEVAVEVMKAGVFANIPFRQMLGITAAYCHIRSALEYRKKTKYNGIVNYLLILSILLGLIYSIILIIARNA